MPPHQNPSLPVHSIGDLIQVRRIEHKNPYDFTREHRHTYFEVFFFETGGGTQLIDFVNLPVREQSCYIVYPQQIHLLKRSPKARGRLVQFGEEVVESRNLRQLLQQHFMDPTPAVFFEKSKPLFTRKNRVLDLLQSSLETEGPVSKEISLHFLEALLLMCLSSREGIQDTPMHKDRELLFKFRQFLETQYCDNHRVARYAADLGVTEKKLAVVTNQFLGLTPLQVIHNRLLLEAKRLLLTGEVSHKEIAFVLGFDSPSSFSLFIKAKTGHSPSSLLKELVHFHK